MNEKKLAVLRALIVLDRPNAISIEDFTKIPKSTIEKIIPRLRKEYLIDIIFIPPPRTGYYELRSWGVFESGVELKKFLKLKKLA